MHQELDERSDFFGGETTIDSIYYGGGTPSLLDPSEIERFLRGVRSRFNVSRQAEITLEANPDDLEDFRLEQWLQMGINRLSIGVQSFRQEDLELMNRSHDALQANKGLKRARDAGFTNFSLDLIYGVPGQPLDVWKQNIRKAIDSGATHISAYCLTIEPRTVFSNWVKKGKLNTVEDETAIEQLKVLRELLTDAGFRHYEISNFAKPGFEAVHNSSYWSGEPYLGIGPSAHSFKGLERRWNIANNIRYAQGVSTGKNEVYELEELSISDRWNELVMTGLRTRRGIDLNQLSRLTDKPIEELFPAEWKEHESSLVKEGNRLSLHPASWHKADGIASDFFMV